MATVTKSQLTGGKQLVNMLRQLPEQMQQKVLVRATRKGAKIVKEEIQQRAPVGDIDISSEKKANRKLKYSRKKDAYEVVKLRSEIKEKLIKKSPEEVIFAIHAGRAFWAQFFEFGTRHMSKQPFFRPGFDTASPRALEKMAEDVGKGAIKQAEKLAGRYKKSGLR